MWLRQRVGQRRRPEGLASKNRWMRGLPLKPHRRMPKEMREASFGLVPTLSIQAPFT
jgi:hypothetical protein